MIIALILFYSMKLGIRRSYIRAMGHDASLRKALGFALSHVVNFVLQWALLLLFIHVGVPKSLAMIPVSVFMRSNR